MFKWRPIMVLRFLVKFERIKFRTRVLLELPATMVLSMANTRSSYYRSNYVPGQKIAYKISRSKIELFMQCQRCFWLDARLHISRPNGPPFNINKAIDELFKKEFDSYRAKGQAHPLMIEYEIDVIPMKHDQLNVWRENFKGVSTIHKPTNLFVFGAIDDLWVNSAGQAVVVDYKATSKDKQVNIDSDWQISYKRQLEIYQWLLRQNGLDVSSTGYFVYTNVDSSGDGFFNKLDFQTRLIPYEGDDSWVEPTLKAIKDCLEDNNMPPVGMAAMGGVCDFCSYAKQRTELTLIALDKTKVRKS